MMNFDWIWDIQVPLPVLLAVTATLGYMVGRWRRSGELFCPRCNELLERIKAEDAKAKVKILHKV
jgi:hypothetical protein